MPMQNSNPGDTLKKENSKANNQAAERLPYETIDNGSHVPRPEQFCKALHASAVLRLIAFMDASQKLYKSKNAFNYTSTRRNVAFSVMQSFLDGEKFNVTKCAEEKGLSRENVHKILREVKAEGFVTDANEPTQLTYDLIIKAMGDLLECQELTDLVSVVASHTLIEKTKREAWK